MLSAFINDAYSFIRYSKVMRQVFLRPLRYRYYPCCLSYAFIVKAQVESISKIRAVNICLIPLIVKVSDEVMDSYDIGHLKEVPISPQVLVGQMDYPAQLVKLPNKVPVILDSP